ncbi:MAG: DinB family protein, partial [Gemmatimonadaceae bacterium]
MSRGQRVGEHIERSVSGPMWHGPVLADLVGDVTAQQAAARPIPGAHTIWELVLHVTAWNEIARERLIGSAKADPTPEEDWPPVRDTSPEAWRSALE